MRHLNINLLDDSLKSLPWCTDRVRKTVKLTREEKDDDGTKHKRERAFDSAQDAAQLLGVNGDNIDKMVRLGKTVSRYTAEYMHTCESKHTETVSLGTGSRLRSSLLATRRSMFPRTAG